VGGVKLLYQMWEWEKGHFDHSRQQVARQGCGKCDVLESYKIQRLLY